MAEWYWVLGSCVVPVTLRPMYSRKMISCSWKSPSSVCVEPHFGQAWKKANTLPNQNTKFDKRSGSKQKHKRAKPLGWTWAFNSPCARHSPRLIALKKFLWTSASSPCPILCGLYLHLLAFFMARTFTGQIYFIRSEWWILLFKKSSYGPQFVHSHIRPFALLFCCPVNRAQAVQHKLGFSYWGRKRGHEQLINKASASRSWRLHWKLALVLV